MNKGTLYGGPRHGEMLSHVMEHYRVPVPTFDEHNIFDVVATQASLVKYHTYYYKIILGTGVWVSEDVVKDQASLDLLAAYIADQAPTGGGLIVITEEDAEAMGDIA